MSSGDGDGDIDVAEPSSDVATKLGSATLIKHSKHTVTANHFDQQKVKVAPKSLWLGAFLRPARASAGQPQCLMFLQT